MADPNLFTDAADYEGREPEGYRSGEVPVHAREGEGALTVRAYEVPPGESMCPYHYEYEEEWLIVLAGRMLLRTPDGERVLDAGAVVRFPPGPPGAHKVSCHGDQTARAVMFSSARTPAVAVYPDSDKIGVWTSESADELMVHRADGGVDYWDGEG